MLEHCAGIILAGGRSSRMGEPKAWLDFHGVPLLDRIIRRLRGIIPEFVVVSAPGQELPPVDARIVHDELPGEGPVGGIIAGLKAVERPFSLVLSCDVPFVQPAIVEYLAGVAGCYDVAVPEWEGRMHPLHAIYRTSVLPELEALFQEGKRRPFDLYERVRTVTVRREELEALDPEGRSFININRPEDYHAALAMDDDT